MKKSIVYKISNGSAYNLLVGGVLEKTHLSGLLNKGYVLSNLSPEKPFYKKLRNIKPRGKIYLRLEKNKIVK